MSELAVFWQTGRVRSLRQTDLACDRDCGGHERWRACRTIVAGFVGYYCFWITTSTGASDLEKMAKASTVLGVGSVACSDYGSGWIRSHSVSLLLLRTPFW